MANEKDETPMLSDTYIKSDEQETIRSPKIMTPRTRSASMSIPSNSKDPYENPVFVGHTGPLRTIRRSSFANSSGPLRTNESNIVRYPSLTIDQKYERSEEKKNEHLLKSGQLGRCNDPYCTTCPSYYHDKGSKDLKAIDKYDSKFHNILYGDAKSWAKKIYSTCNKYIPGVMNPHTKRVQQWNQFFAINCLIAVFLDPLFFFLLLVRKEEKCIMINWPMTKTLVALRSITDFIYLLHIILQFRLAYVVPESRVVGAGELEDSPKEIARHYFFGYFFIDFFILLPLPQIIVLIILPKDSIGGLSGAEATKNTLRAAILIQYIPRLFRFLPLLAGQTPSGFIFESAWANFVMNLLTFVLSGHVVGSCWYLFGLQRVNQCLRDACHGSVLKDCYHFIDCGHGNAIEKFKEDKEWASYKNSENGTECFLREGGDFSYGIYIQAVQLTTTKYNLVQRYIYSFFWGFQQISTLAGNQVPSYFIWEVLFTMGIIGLGLLLFALLIGNMQNFLQSLGRRRLEMSLRRRDVEQWMSHRRLPEILRRKVREAERYHWAATQGVNEERLLENLPEDLQREIRQHLCNFIKKVRIFSLLDEPILDAICERLRQKTYIQGSKILYHGGLVEKMVFIIRGKGESIGEDGIIAPLIEGQYCGEELLTWYLEHSSVNRDGKRLLGHRLLSTREVRCVTNVEVFILRAADLEEVTSVFARFLRNPRVQGAIRYESPYWRGLAVVRIQVAWRYRKKRLGRVETSSP